MSAGDYTVAELDEMIAMYRIMARSKRASDDQKREALDAVFRYSSMRNDLLFAQASAELSPQCASIACAGCETGDCACECHNKRKICCHDPRCPTFGTAIPAPRVTGPSITTEGRTGAGTNRSDPANLALD